MTELKLEVGKYYKIRSGHKAVIDRFFDLPTGDEFHGGIFINGRVFPSNWNAEGRTGISMRDDDIIALWEEDEPEMEIRWGGL